MKNKLTVVDYNADWAMRGPHIHPREHEGSLSREEVVEFYGTLGVDGVELMHHYWEDVSPEYVRKVADGAGLPIYAYVFFQDIAWPAELRAKELDQVRRLLDRTAALGATKAFYIPVIVKEEYSLEAQRGWLIEGLREAAEHAAMAGVTIMMENIDYPPTRPLTGKAADCAALCRSVDHPNFRLIFDSVAPVFNEEDSLEALKIMGDYMVHAHLKNTRPVSPPEKSARTLESLSGSPYMGALLDGGVVPQAKILEALRQRGYQGGLLIEYQGENDPRPALQYNVEYLRRLMDRLGD